MDFSEVHRLQCLEKQEILSQMKAKQVQVPCWLGQLSLPLLGAGFPAPRAVPSILVLYLHLLLLAAL